MCVGVDLCQLIHQTGIGELRLDGRMFSLFLAENIRVSGLLCCCVVLLRCPGNYLDFGAEFWSEESIVDRANLS